MCVEYICVWSFVFWDIIYWEIIILMMKIVKVLDVWKREGGGYRVGEEEEFFKIEYENYYDEGSVIIY